MKRFWSLGVLGLSIIFLTQASAAFAAFTYKITVISPAGGETWTIGTRQRVDWTVDSTNPAFGGYTLKVELVKSDGSCVSGLPCPIVLGTGQAKDSPYYWLVGYDSNGRLIPAGSYVIKVWWDGQDGIADPVKPYEGVSGTINIVTSAPAPTRTPTPVGVKTPTPTPVRAPTGGTTGTTTGCTDNAVVTSQDLLSSLSLKAGETKTVTVNVQNTGNTNWTDGAYYQLRNSASQNLLTPVYGHLPNAVSAGGTAAWTFTITAPQTAGSYPINLQMVHNSGGQYIKNTGAKCAAPASNLTFGQALNSTVQVSGTPSPSNSATPPPTVAGSSNWFMDNLLYVGMGALALVLLIVLLVLIMRRRASGLVYNPPMAGPQNIPVPNPAPTPNPAPAPVPPSNPSQNPPAAS